MDPASTWQIVTLVVLVSLSAFFSGTETAFTSFNKTRMKTMAQNGDKKARSVMWVEEHYEKFLSTILVGNNIVNISASTISALLFASLLKGNANVAATVSTIVMTVVVLIFGEITPKFLGKDFADNYTLKTAGIVRFLMTVLTPLTAFFSLWRLGLSKVVKGDPALSITEDEIMTMVDEAQSEGGIDEHEGDLIRSAIEFNDLEVSTILTPRVDIVAIRTDTPMDDVLELFRTCSYSRLPVYRGSIDNIVGVVHEKDFNRLVYDGATDFSAAIHDVLFITESLKISRLLREFQSAKTHMAIVVDEYGGTSGLITLEDLLEEIVGNIYDEFDPLDTQEIIKLEPNLWRMRGSVEIETLQNELNIELPEDDEEHDFHTLGGLVFSQLSEIPPDGAQPELDAYGLHLKVEVFAERRVEWVLVSKIETAEEDEQESAPEKND